MSAENEWFGALFLYRQSALYKWIYACVYEQVKNMQNELAKCAFLSKPASSTNLVSGKEISNMQWCIHNVSEPVVHVNYPLKKSFDML